MSFHGNKRGELVAPEHGEKFEERKISFSHREMFIGLTFVVVDVKLS